VAGTAGAPGSTREVELKRAIKAARLPSRDRNLFRDLLETANWKSAVLPDRFQPRNMDELARIAGVSTRTALRSVDHLEKHGWITRTRNPKPGRQGRAITYGFEVGESCWCTPDRPAAASGIDRTRKWRERKQRQICVTDPAFQRQDAVTIDARERHGIAGQNPSPAEEGRDEGKRSGDYLGGAVQWDWPEGSYGEKANPS
jgi:predicted transcriptional regulator